MSIVSYKQILEIRIKSQPDYQVVIFQNAFIIFVAFSKNEYISDSGGIWRMVTGGMDGTGYWHLKYLLLIPLVLGTDGNYCGTAGIFERPAGIFERHTKEIISVFKSDFSNYFSVHSF